MSSKSKIYYIRNLIVWTIESNDVYSFCLYCEKKVSVRKFLPYFDIDYFNLNKYKKMDQYPLIVTYPTEPNLPFTDNSTIDNSFIGSDSEIVKYLANALNFKLAYNRNKDFAWGSLVNEEKNEFNGMIGMVQRKEADIAIGSITITALRETAIDFTNYYQLEYLAVFGIRPQPMANWLAIFEPFDKSTWILLIVTLINVTIMNWIATRILAQEFSNIIYNSFFDVITLFTGQSISDKSRSKMSSIIYGFWCCGSFLICIGKTLSKIINHDIYKKQVFFFL